MKRVLAVIIALVVGFAGGFVAAKQLGKKDVVKPSIDFEILKQEVKEISELATLQETYTAKVPYNTESKKLWKTKFKIPFSSKSMVAEYSATLKMGLKLTDDNYDVKGDDNAITVTLPHSEILSHEIDEDSWVLKDEKNGLFNPLKPEDDSKLRKLAKNRALEELDMDSLFKKADENAQEQIKDFLVLACPNAEITVIFK